MNAFLISLVATLFAAMAFAQEPDASKASEPAERPKDAKNAYRHVVLFKFKDGTDAETITKIETAFHALPEKIDTIIDYEWGTNVSPEGLNKGNTHCFLVTFKDKAGLDIYLPHPAHEAFVEDLLPHLDGATVLDYVSKEK